MAAEQNNRCRICREPKKLGVDHNHTTGEVRGLLCQQCNVGVGRVENNVSRVLAFLAYLGIEPKIQQQQQA